MTLSALFEKSKWSVLTDSQLSVDSTGGGAWPFFVGRVTCLVTSVSVCTEQKRRERKKKEERRKKKVESRK